MTTTKAEVYRWTDRESDFPMPLLERRRVIGEKVMISQVKLTRGCFVPSHAHENEQFACILEGCLRFGLGVEGSPEHRQVLARAGDVVHLPSGIPHSAEAVEDTLVLDVFAPPSATTGIDRNTRSSH